MTLIDRKITSTVTTTEKSQTSLYCQASFNSDGHITLRNYNIRDKSCDEIILLSTEETQAIIELFKKISNQIKTNELPF